MVYNRSKTIKIIEIEHAKILIRKLINFLKNENLKKYLIVLEEKMLDIDFIENETKKITRIIVDSFDYEDREVEIVLNFIEYLKKIYKFDF